MRSLFLTRVLAVCVLGCLAEAFTLPSSSFATDSDYVAPHGLTEENPTSVHQFIYHIKPDTEPVGILMKDVTFSIPRNYLASLYKVRPYTPVGFTIMTFYPDFAGSKTEDEGVGRMTEQSKIWRWGLSPNLIVIYGGAHDDPQQGNQHRIFATKLKEPNLPWKYDLLTTSTPPPTHGEDIYFQRPTKTGDGIVIFCDRDDNTGCTVNMRITPYVGVSYQYHPQLLPHWQEINQKVTDLVQSFIVKKEQ